MGIEAAAAQLRLLRALGDPVLSLGAEVWGRLLVVRAAVGNISAGCAAENLHLSFLRHMLS